MRIQSTRDFSERGLDAYFTCPEAIESLILLEGDRLPQRIWEPAAGDGAIVKPLRARGRIVHASASCTRPTSRITVCRAAASWIPVRPDPADRRADGLVTNPPYGLAQEFAAKALDEVPYVALLVRTNFLMDGEARGRWLDRKQPTRVYYLLPRLPMMHRHGWEGTQVDEQHPALLGRLGGRRAACVAPARLLAGTAHNRKAADVLLAQAVSVPLEPAVELLSHAALLGWRRRDIPRHAAQPLAHFLEFFEKISPHVAALGPEGQRLAPLDLPPDPTEPGGSFCGTLSGRQHHRGSLIRWRWPRPLRSCFSCSSSAASTSRSSSSLIR